MTPDREQAAATAQDLRSNLVRAALSPEELASWLHLSADELDDVLAVRDGVATSALWAVRDAIEKTLRDEGDAGQWDVLTEEHRPRP